MSSNLLIDESPLCLQSSLAVVIGLNEAIFLQQCHYWLNPKFNKHSFQGKHWVHKTLQQWRKEFPFWGEKTIRRVISSLEQNGIVVSRVKSNGFTKSKFYSINYDLLNTRIPQICHRKEGADACGHYDQIDIPKWADGAGIKDDQVDSQVFKPAKTLGADACGQSDQIDVPKRADASGQSDQMEVVNMTRSYRDKITTEITLSPESSQNSSSPSSNSDEREIALQMLSTWNEVLPQKSLSTLSGFLKEQLEAAYHLHLNASLTQWKLVCENFKSSKFLMGEAEGVRIKPDLAWLLDLRKDHLHNVLTKSKYTFDDRVSNTKVKTVKDIEADIEASNDDLELKSLKRDALQISPICYLGYFRHSRFEMDNQVLRVFVPTSYAKEQIEERSYGAISDLVRNKYNRSFEVSVEQKQ